jgi:MATE family, multidrug efflux pump
VKSALILRLAGPLVISFWLRSAFAWVDTFFAAALEGLEGVVGLGDASIAAIGLALPFEFLTIACWVGSSNGLTARLAAAIGAGESDRVGQLKRASARIVWVLCGGFLVLAAGVWWLSPRVLEDPLLARQFQLYGTILIGGSAVTSFWSILPDSIVKAHQDTQGTMWAGLLSTFTNVILNTVFVFVFGWGIAASTVLSRIASLVYAWYRAAGHERRWKAELTTPQAGLFDRPVQAILVLAIPGALTYLLMSVESLAVFGLIANLPPQELAIPLLAAWSIFDRALRFLLMPGIALSVALLPLTARHSGRGDYRQIELELGVAQRAGWIYSLAVVLPMCLLAGPWLSRALSKTPETQAFAAEAMPWIFVGVLVSIPFFLARSTFDGLQRPRPGLIASIIRAFVFFIPGVLLGYTLSRWFGFSPMHGLCAGASLGLAAGSWVIHNWISRQLKELAADQSQPMAAFGAGRLPDSD